MSIASEFASLYGPFLQQKQRQKGQMQYLQQMDMLTRDRQGLRRQHEIEMYERSKKDAEFNAFLERRRKTLEEALARRREEKREDYVREDEQKHEMAKARIYGNQGKKPMTPEEYAGRKMIDLGVSTGDVDLIKVGKRMWLGEPAPVEVNPYDGKPDLLMKNILRNREEDFSQYEE